MKVLGLIPARGGSKGVPGKNSKLLGGKPLIEYTITTALSCKSLARVVVITDDSGIANISKKLGAEVPFLRPEKLASDASPTVDAVVHALQFFADLGEHFDAVCLLQPTVPFRTVPELDAAIAQFKADGTDSLVSVCPVPDKYNPHWTFLQSEPNGRLHLATGEEQIITRRQDLPKAFVRDGSIYLTKSRVVLEEYSLYGSSTAGFVNSSNPLINIDTPDDWALAEEYLARHGS